MESNMEVTGLITPLVNAYKALNNEWKHLMDIGISEYLDSQTEKFYYTNTFLHQGVKVKFYDIYHPIQASYNALTTNFKNTEEIFENYKCITIIGSAGSGKSTLMRYIFLETIKQTNRIPILIELRNLNDYEGDLEKLIIDRILKSRIKPSDETLKRALLSGRFLFLLDGYDEIFSNRKEVIKREIENFVDNYHNNRFLMTTRPGSGIESFPRFHNFQIRQLTTPDIEFFIDKMVDDAERKSRIKAVINDKANQNYVHYLGNPLLLSMFILAFKSHPEIPARKTAFYRNVFDTLYSRHDGITKNSFARERLTRLQRDDFEELLNTFSYVTLCKGQYAFTNERLTDTFKKIKASTELQFNPQDLITDLQTSISILILDGFEYRFPHRSMQEYFAAQFISNLKSDKKLKAYKKLHGLLKSTDSAGSYELWNLCNELDPVYFVTYFIIPSLKEFAEQLNEESDEELIRTYCELWNLFIQFDARIKSMTVMTTPNFLQAIFRYYKINAFPEIGDFIMHSEATGKIVTWLKGTGRQATFVSQETDNELLKILLENGFAERIRRYRSFITEHITSLEAELIRKENNIEDLLDLV